MQCLSHRLSTRFRRQYIHYLFVLAIPCIAGSRSPAQEPAQLATQQAASIPQLNTSQPCYLAGTARSQSDSQEIEPPSAEPATSADQVNSNQQQDPETLASLNQSDLQETRPASAQPVMSAAQIISILQQDQDSLASLKEIGGQRYGVDPAIISDDGIYACIRQDPGLRSQISDALKSRGYSVNPEKRPIKSDREASRTGSSRFAQSVPQPAVQQLNDVQTRKPIPYPHLPSLVDLYSQDTPVTRKLRRFGSDTFRFGTGNADELPMDLPVGPDYVLGPGDTLVLNMWGGQSNRIERTVDRQGQIALPEAGTVTIVGFTIAQAQNAIQQALNTQFQNEHVEISLGRVRTVRVYVVGDVQRPGAYDVTSLSSPLNALYAAGGPTSTGSLRILRQYRGKQLIREIDLYDFLLHGVRSDLDRLLPGDTVLVPPAGPQVTVAGMVRRPAIYELKGLQDLKDVLDLAGGLLVSASLQEIRVERVDAHERHTMLSVRLPDGARGNSAKLPSFQVQDGDQVIVAPILPYNDQVVYLDGHVFKPGPYAWRDGMTVNDLLHSYQDVMPEPAAHAEIIRLQAPDFRPETISFNLSDILIGDDPITLQPFDVVRIFGRYDIDPPKVSIDGEVLRPGVYPMSRGMTVSDLVRMAGGFRRSAYREVADLSSYQIRNDKSILIGHSVVAIEKALGGDKSADVTLKPGDVVGIRQLTGWNDIGSAITIDGEVKYAGTYGIEDGERLSSVLKRAGGFRENAYPVGAVLERVQVRQMEENSRQEMIRRIEVSVPSVAPGVSTTTQDQQNLLQAMRQQQQEVLTALRNHPSTGRLVLKISGDISKWENTPADIVIRAGDKLTIPKKPDFVLVSGQVYNATAITYHPGKNAGWYLHQAGGATRSGDKKQIFILRADGSVVGNEKTTVFSTGALGVRMYPGDSIIVPEKVIGGSMLWRNVLGTAQIMSSVALTGAVAGAF